MFNVNKTNKKEKISPEFMCLWPCDQPMIKLKIMLETRAINSYLGRG